MTFAYIRCSTLHQKTDRQHDMISKYKPDKIFEEKISGRIKDRPQLIAMLDMMRAGDTLYIESLSRLGRSSADLLALLEKLNAMGVNVISLKEDIDMSSPTGRLLLTVMAALAGYEAEILQTRTMEGLAAARARGRVGGRPTVNRKQVDIAIKMYKSGVQAKEVCAATGISKSTLYKYIRESA